MIKPRKTPPITIAESTKEIAIKSCLIFISSDNLMRRNIGATASADRSIRVITCSNPTSMLANTWMKTLSEITPTIVGHSIIAVDVEIFRNSFAAAIRLFTITFCLDFQQLQ
jgi:hypothetical protein